MKTTLKKYKKSLLAIGILSLTIVVFSIFHIYKHFDQLPKIPKGKKTVAISDMAIENYTYIQKNSEGTFKYKKSQDIKKIYDTYFYENKNGILNFYYSNKEGKVSLLSTYTCRDESCYFYAQDQWHYISGTEKKAILCEGVSTSSNKDCFLYNFSTGKKISNTYTEFQNLYNNKDETKYLIITNDNKYGVIDLNGHEVITPEYEKMAYQAIGLKTSDYSIEHNYITAKKATGWGVVNLNDGKVLTPEFVYNECSVFDNKYFAVKTGTLWYLSNDKEEQVIPYGYEFIKPFGDIIITVRNKTLAVVNTTGEQINSDTIPTFMSYNKSAGANKEPGIKAETNKDNPNIIDIYINRDLTIFVQEPEIETRYYQYNINTNDFTRIEY